MTARGTTRRRKRPAGETEGAFIAVATQRFAERGYHGTSIMDLASELGLTTASLYYHVSGKQELLLRVLETGMAQLLSSIEDVMALDVDPIERLRLAVEGHLSYVLANKETVAVFLRERRFLESPLKEQYEVGVDRYDTFFAELVKAAIEFNGLAVSDPGLIRLAILGMINWVVEWYDPAGRLSSEEILKTYTGLIIDRIMTPPAT